MLRDAPFTEDELIDALNSLYEQNKVAARANANGELVYEFVEKKKRDVFDKLDFIEIEVYKIIEMSGSWGRSKAELKSELNKQMKAMEHEQVNAAQLDKMLKKMAQDGKVREWDS